MGKRKKGATKSRGRKGGYAYAFANERNLRNYDGSRKRKDSNQHKYLGIQRGGRGKGRPGEALPHHQ